MRLYTMDAWVSDPAVLTDESRLRDALRAGARAGGAHLSLHTWPELSLANVDLLSYGDVQGEAVLGEIRERLVVERAEVTCVPRAVG
jgi:S-adenosylmethionine decarboxylase